MADWDQEQRDRNGRALDSEIEAVLEKYSSVDPRPGLEQRILATLRAKRQSVHRGWWQWSAPIAATVLTLAMIVACVAVWKAPRVVETGASRVRPEPSRMVHSGMDVKRSCSGVAESSRQVMPAYGSGAIPHRRPNAAGRAFQPKLDQFPSPRPLSEQEKILASYVANFPETAALVAQATAEALRIDMEEEAAALAKDSRQ